MNKKEENDKVDWKRNICSDCPDRYMFKEGRKSVFEEDQADSIVCDECANRDNYHICIDCPESDTLVNSADNVNQPQHYTFGTIEVIDVIEDWELGFHEANIIKYVARAKHKGRRVEDLKKAQWYLNRLLETDED